MTGRASLRPREIPWMCSSPVSDGLWAQLGPLFLADCCVTWPLSPTLSIAYSLGSGSSCWCTLSLVWSGCGTGKGGPYLEHRPTLFLSKAECLTPVISVLGRLRQEDHMSTRLASAMQFQVNLVYGVRQCLKTKTKNEGLCPCSGPSSHA